MLVVGLSKKDIKIVYINLDHRKDRRQTMESRLESAGLSAKRFSAVNGYELSEKQICSLNKKAVRDLLPGELGCLLSHYSVWKWAKLIPEDYIWILEDDVRLAPILDQLLATLDKLNQLDSDWHLLHVKSQSSTKFFYQICQPEHILPELDPLHPILDEMVTSSIYRVGPQIGAYSYVLSKKGLNASLKNFSVFRNPVDVQLGQLINVIPSYLWICRDIEVFIDGNSDTQGEYCDPDL